MQQQIIKKVVHQYLTGNATECITAIGNADILKRKKLALFCSIKCPGNIILKAFDLAQALRDAGITVISGFHSPMEREVSSILLRSKNPVIVCPARGIEGMRMPKEYRKPLEEERLLILSPFEKNIRRATAKTSGIRNAFAAALADSVLVAHAAPDSKTETFARSLIEAGKKLYTLDSDDNKNIISIGARPIKPSDVNGIEFD